MRLQAQPQQDTTKLSVPYVQEGYLQEHYSPTLPRKKLHQKENPIARVSDERLDNNEPGSPRPKRKPVHYAQTKSDNNNVLNKNVDLFETGVRRVTASNGIKSAAQQSGELTRVPPNSITVEKKKLKYSPPPEGTVLVRHQAVNADKSFDNLSNRSSTSGRVTRRLLAAMFRGGLKLKERLLVGVSVATVLFTLLLVIDLQMDTGMTGSHLMSSHARVKYADGQEYNSFRNRLLQKTTG